ncbi:MAG: ABC transporter permease subunit [Pseudonocardiaceae bacterium]|nr:ABC transporter permease subunit [Pseudonocardiaceae bacterium]
MTTTSPANRTSAAQPARAEQPRPGRARGMPGWAWWVICGLIGIMFLAPVALLLSTVFKTPEAAVQSPPDYLPSQPSAENFSDLGSTGSGVWRYIANTLVVSLGTVGLSVVVSTLAGYGFAHFRVPFGGVLFGTVLLSIMIPFQAILPSLYKLLQFLSLQNSLLGLILVYATFQMPLSVFLMRNSFAQVPVSLVEAAEIDGCSSLGALRRVMLPVVRPGMISVALFAFFSSWNEFLAALVLLSNDDKFTLPIFLTSIATGRLGAIEWGVLEAGVLVTMVPCVLIFLLLQRYYVRGIVAGSLK